jgi:tryptophanyl-tRNA synthetase
VLHSTSTVVEGHAEMNPPRLIRPLRPFLQGQLPLTAPRSAVVGIPRASIQLRTYASVEVPSTGEKSSATPPAQNAKSDKPAVSRMPRALEALYLKPLRREVEYGVPSCNLQLRSYSVRNLEFFCDFALRAAYYLGLPAFGPVPLPRKVQRWTVPKSTFIFKKSQENFERITLRRMIQIRDGNPETVQLWLAFLQKHAYYGIGMKANVWEFSKLGVGKEMDKSLEQTEKLMEDKWEHLSYVERRPEFQKKKDRGPREQLPPAEDMEAFLASERRKIAGGR